MIGHRSRMLETRAVGIALLLNDRPFDVVDVAERRLDTVELR